MSDRGIALDGTFILAEIGSRAFGLDTPESDTDLMGVCFEPPDTVFGPRTFESFRWRSQPAGVRSTKDDTDVVIYSLRKYVALALAGNPTVLLLLFTPSGNNPWENQLKGLSRAFWSRQAAAKFIGYLISQRDKMTGERRQHTNRPELIAKHGYDTKFAAAAVRLGVTGVQFLAAGEIELPMSGTWAEQIRAIRRGEVTQDRALNMIDSLLTQLKKLGGEPAIPEFPKVDLVTDFVHEAQTAFWNHGPLSNSATLKLAEVMG